MDILLKELGYRINYDTLRHEHKEALKEEMTPETQRWYDAAAPYLVMAYQAGREGRNLNEAFHFLEAMS